MYTPLVTIAIPIYNAKDYLASAIQSCINQTYLNWELLLMEDGSTDGSYDIAYEFASRDKRIQVLSDGKNRGLVYRLNESIRRAKGKYYARMDADDIMVVTRIEEEVLFLEKHFEVDVVGASIMTIDNHNKIIGSEFTQGNVCSFIHPTIMGRIEWFKQNLYEEWALRADDFELWTRTSSMSTFYAIGKPLLFYREFGVPSFRKNFLSQRTMLKIFSRYHQYNKSFIWFVKNSLFMFVKIIIYAFFAFVGQIDYIIGKRRRKKLPAHLCLSETNILEAIRCND